MSQSDTDLLPLVARYFGPATRLVSWQLLHKEQAADVLSVVFEDLYDSGHFYEGPHFRAALLQRIKWACILANKLPTKGLPGLPFNTTVKELKKKNSNQTFGNQQTAGFN